MPTIELIHIQETMTIFHESTRLQRGTVVSNPDMAVPPVDDVNHQDSMLDTPTRQHIDADYSRLVDARELVRPHLLGNDEDADTMYLIAVTEVFTNAVESHRRAEVDEPIEIVVDIDGGHVTISDRGDGYDPADRSRRRHAADGGRGLDIAESAVPTLAWRSNNPGTSFILPYAF